MPKTSPGISGRTFSPGSQFPRQSDTSLNDSTFGDVLLLKLGHRVSFDVHAFVDQSRLPLEVSEKV